MSYYNSTSPRQDHASSFAQQPYSPSAAHARSSPGNNSFVNSTPTYISSPFDDDPVVHNPPSQHNTTNYEKNSPYNPDYMPSTYKNQSTQEHNLSPSFKEKSLAPGADQGGQTYAMQHLGNQYDYGNNNNNNSQLNTNQHNSHESYGYSNHQGNNNNNNNGNYYNGYDEDRPSLSNDTAPMRPYGDMETSEGLTRSKSGVTRVKYRKEKSKYLPCFPCIRSTCGRVTCCICLLLLLIIIVLAIVVVTVFKLPTVNYLGMQSEPVFQFNQGDTTLQVQLVVNIEVKNPNPLGFKFESIVATAYYPNYAPSIGGGNLTNVEFPSHSNRTIAFPIKASYSASQDAGYTVVADILSRCGQSGHAATQLTINYDLTLTLRILFFNISPTVKNQHVNLDCPADIGSIASNVSGGLAGVIGGKK